MAKHRPAWATFFALATAIVPSLAESCQPATEPYDNSADNPPEKQGVEHSAAGRRWPDESEPRGYVNRTYAIAPTQALYRKTVANR